VWSDLGIGRRAKAQGPKVLDEIGHRISRLLILGSVFYRRAKKAVLRLTDKMEISVISAECEKKTTDPEDQPDADIGIMMMAG
jgi:hypothetical protein